MLDKYFPLYAVVFASALILTAVIEKRFIPFLKRYAKQPIYEEGPSWHMKKSGTPTMGGVAFVSAITLSLLVASIFLLINDNTELFYSLLISVVFALGNALIGLIDDMTKLKRKENAGLTPLQKLLLQLGLCIAFLLSRYFLVSESTSLSFSFGKTDLGFFYYPLAVFVLLGIINCANLTDGIDGLASSVAFGIGVSLFYISAALSPESSLIAAAVIGGGIGFLIFNLHPAKIFMGDTGSLFFGALISSCGFILDNFLIVLLLGGVYVIEGFSVVVQVIFFKLTGKRVFKMAPIHHHFEKSGFSENKICLLAIFITFVLSIPVYVFYLP